MNDRFLQNNQEENQSFLKEIRLLLKNAGSVDIAVSYLKMSGWFHLKKYLHQIPVDKIRILATVQMCLTQPDVLLDAFNAGMLIRIYTGDRTYHPKVYIAQYENNTPGSAIVSSANISDSALRDGIEAGIRVSNPKIIRNLNRWFNQLFNGTESIKVDSDYIKMYEKQWNLAAQDRAKTVRRKRIVKIANNLDVDQVETLDDVFSTLKLPIGTLGFDHAGNNIRNLSRLKIVLDKYPKVSYKENSELHLLGFKNHNGLTTLGTTSKSCKTKESLAKVWCAWIKKTPDHKLLTLNPRLVGFKRAAARFWNLNSGVRSFFLDEITNSKSRAALQAIELLCNCGSLIHKMTLPELKVIAPAFLTGNKLPSSIKYAIEQYRANKGSRSWLTDDRRTVLLSWKK
jgi:HKD family nuclease